jgi:hypothetical protein
MAQQRHHENPFQDAFNTTYVSPKTFIRFVY